MIKKILSFGITGLLASLTTATGMNINIEEVDKTTATNRMEIRNVSANQDHGISKANALSNYSTAEKALFAKQPALESAIVSSYSHNAAAWQIEMDKIDNLPAYSSTSNTIVGSAAGTYNVQANIKRIIRVFDEQKFNEIFPVRRAVYDYRGFLKAAAKFPTFCAEKNDADSDISSKSLDQVCKRELASMFAHFAQEVGAHVSGGGTVPASAQSGADNQGRIHEKASSQFPAEEWKQGLYWVEEISHAGATTSGYALCEGWQGKAYPCGTSVSYHGRGAKQLSWNYNYGPFSQAMYGDNRLLDDPTLVAQRGELAFGSAFWFYMTPRSPKPSIHETVTGFWQPTSTDTSGKRHKGFGVQTMIINGGLECGGSTDKPTAKNRQTYFEALASDFGVSNWYSAGVTEKNDCRNMIAFQNKTDSPYYYKGYYTKGWDGSGTCILVAWEASGFTPFKPGDLAACNASADGVSRPGTGGTNPTPPNDNTTPTPPEVAPTPPPTLPETNPNPPVDNGQGTVDGGNWNSSTIYWGGTVVEYNGVEWKSKWWTQGDVPGTAMVWEKVGGTYVPPVTQPPSDTGTGAPEQQPTVPSTPPVDVVDGADWVANQVYIGGDTVKYGGETYEAKWWNAGIEPDSGDPVWRCTSCANVTREWSSKSIYLGGDSVYLNGTTYKAKWWTQGEKPGSAMVWEKVS